MKRLIRAIRLEYSVWRAKRNARKWHKDWLKRKAKDEAGKVKGWTEGA